MRAWLIFLIMVITACSATKEITEIKPKVIKPEVIEDTLPGELSDTIIVAQEIIQNDTVKYIEFRPDPILLTKIEELKRENKSLGKEIIKLGEFYFKIKPDSIIVLDTTRTRQTIEKIVETPFLSKLGLVFIGMLTIIVVLLVLKFIKK